MEELTADEAHFEGALLNDFRTTESNFGGASFAGANLEKAQLASEAMETVPDGVKKFTINATNAGTRMKTDVAASTPFMLNDEAVTALRRLFLLYEKAGMPLKGLAMQFAEKPDGWSMSTEYDYA